MTEKAWTAGFKAGLEAAAAGYLALAEMAAGVGSLEAERANEAQAEHILGIEVPPPPPEYSRQPISTAPQTRAILVYAQDVACKEGRTIYGEPLPSFFAVVKWHPDGGFCVCQIREATHWWELPEPPEE